MLCARRVSAAGLLLGLLGFSASSCLYDGGDRCDAGQIFNADAGLCVCDASQNLIAGEHACVECGEHRVAGNDICSCEEGYTEVAGECVVVPDALGKECSKDADCDDATYDTCHVEGTSGYCTNVDCKDNDDCSGGYGCDTSASPAFCRRPPSGAGMSCSSNTDCEGTEATFCEVFNTHKCFVEGCSLSENDCFPGQECCDLTGPSGGIIKKQICVDAGTCAQ